MNPHPDVVGKVVSTSYFIPSAKSDSLLHLGRAVVHTLLPDEKDLMCLARRNMPVCKCSNTDNQCSNCSCTKRGVSCIYGCGCFDTGRGLLECDNPKNDCVLDFTSSIHEDSSLEVDEEEEELDDSINDGIFHVPVTERAPNEGMESESEA